MTNLAHVTINLDRMDGTDNVRGGYVVFDPRVDVPHAPTHIHVQAVTVVLDDTGRGETDLVAGIAYAVSSNRLRSGHTIAPLAAGQTVDLSQVITTGTPLTPSEGAALAARIAVLEDAPPGSYDDTEVRALITSGDAATLTAAKAYADGITPPPPDMSGYATTATLSAETTARQAADALLTPLTDPRLSDARPPTAHTHPVAQVSDSTTVGRTLVTAADAAAARAAIGAGTSNLALGSTSTTAKAGDYAPAWGEVTGKPTTFAPSAHAHDASDITSGVLAPARLGTGTPSASTVLYGDGAWKAAPTGGGGSGSGLSGTGSPEGVVTAPVGTEYLDTAGTLGAWRWLKTSGSGNTGWVVTYGDTGWRQMKADWNVSPRSSGDGFVERLLIRRVGNRITLACYLDGAFGGEKNHSVAAFLPVGFRNTSSLGVWPEVNRFRLTSSQTTYVDPILETGTAGNLRIITPSSMHEAYSEIAWVTDHPWPTTLPGTPA